MTAFDHKACLKYIDAGHFDKRPAACIAWLMRASERIEELEACISRAKDIASDARAPHLSLLLAIKTMSTERISQASGEAVAIKPKKDGDDAL